MKNNNILVLVGAIAGGAAGYFAFSWLLRSQGLYGMIIPGGFVGLGAGIFKTKSAMIAAICGAMALGLSLFTEWTFAPFLADGSFGYFLRHAHQLPPVKLLMMIAGTGLGFWIPFRRGQSATKAAS